MELTPLKHPRHPQNYDHDHIHVPTDWYGTMQQTLITTVSNQQH